MNPFILNASLKKAHRLCFLFLNQALLENTLDNQQLTREYGILKSKCKDFEDNLNFIVKQDITASENMFFI